MFEIFKLFKSAIAALIPWSLKGKSTLIPGVDIFILAKEPLSTLEMWLSVSLFTSTNESNV